VDVMRRTHLLVAVCAILLLVPASPAAAAQLSSAERSLLVEINRVRAEHRLAPLSVDWTLQRAARAHSADMLRRGYFSHGAFDRRMKRFGARGPALGENLAWGTAELSDARMMVASWLDSRPHRANLLRPGFRRVGVGLAHGSFSGFSNTTVATVDFAGR
jgi:uncharacterized protein YkwD